MKITLISDLHLDISGPLELEGGEVLIIAGDACEVRSLINEYSTVKEDNFFRDQYPGYDFFSDQIHKFDKVFYVMGNHEHYRGKFNQTKGLLKSTLPTKVTILDNDCVEYKGVMFLGATLWTDCNKGDPITMMELKSFMNDYKVITYHDRDKDLYYKLSPEVTIREHKQTLEYFRNQLIEHKDKPFVVITHHAPSWKSVNEKYVKDHLINGGYASDCSSFILDHPNIKYWVHGHMHDGVNYEIGDTNVLANPRGYIPWESGNGFNPAFYFEV
jgi:hypothetical protein